jgi:tRNA pseudouridine32 synthase/23S rRNA pseudouridine746 synthase
LTGSSAASGAALGAGGAAGSGSSRENSRRSRPPLGFCASSSFDAIKSFRPSSAAYFRAEGLARKGRRASYWVMTPEETRARLLYRDGLMLVIDKPAGVAVHKGPKGGPSLEDDFDALRFGLPRKPALAHRLDRETAGCLVLGRHHKALEQLGLLFKQGKVGKAYWAIVEGGPEKPQGLIDLPLGRLDANRGWWMKVDAKGSPAQTRWRVIGRGEVDGRPVAWLELEPLTGRTHQLRVHCAAQGWPIAGDSVYGTAPRGDGSTVRLQLLARRVSVPLAKNKPAVMVEAPAPAHMIEALTACGFAGEPARAAAEAEPAAVGAPLS